MSRSKSIPAYGCHKPSGQARMILHGRHVYLGPYGSPESRAEYARLIAENFRPGVGDQPPPKKADGRYPLISLNELFVRYLTFARAYYVKNGQPTSEVRNMQDAMKTARALYGLTPAHTFGPLALKAVRQAMLDQGTLCRSVINKRVDRLRRIFKWGTSEELVPPGIYEALRTVTGLRRGRSSAYDPEPVRPVADHWVEGTLPFLNPVVGDMVRLQRLTGMRPGNVITIRWLDIAQCDGVWLYRPESHKMEHLGRNLAIPLGPQAQRILQRYEHRPVHLPIFSPQLAAELQHEARRSRPNRRTPVYPCELRRRERERAARKRRLRHRPPGDAYSTSSYARAITYAIAKARRAGVELCHWHPNQLRHQRATEIRKQFGLEGAQVVLGHARADVTQIYAERDLEKAIEIARMTG